MSWTLLIVIVVVLVLFGVYLSATAGRLDRLHHRVDMAYSSLDVQLLRRSSLALEVAMSGMIDPGAALVLADAAILAQDGDRPPLARGQAESDLTKAITVTIGSVEDTEALCATDEGRALIASLSGSIHKAALSRRFYNDAVRACRAVRRQQLVRLFRLAGRTAWPRTVEMDDDIPPGFRGR